MKQSLNIVKVGGQVVEDASRLSTLLDGFSAIPGNRLLVCGGGRIATSVATQLGIESRMVDGRRVTDESMLKVVTMVYAGLVSKNVVAALQARGIDAIGLSGADMDIIRCVRRSSEPVDFGFVGDVRNVNTDAIKLLIDSGVTPVLCPITHDGKGQLLNTNADTIASSVACALAREYDVTLTYCFEKKGVLSDPDNPDSVIPQIRRPDFERLLEQGTVKDGMIPKLENALAAIDEGVRKVIITNADSLTAGSGTEII